MLKPEQVPENVAYAAEAAWANEATWQEIVAAALNAWTGSYSLAENDSAEIREVACIILPLPQEASDDMV